MDRISSLKIGELLTRPVTVDPSAPVSKVIGLLRESKAYEAFVTEEREIRGIVTIRDILRAKQIATGKISSLMTRIPRLEPEDDVSLAARIMTEHRIRAVPVAEGGKLIGQLTAASICELMARSGRWNLNAGRIMTPNPVVLQEDDLATKARTMMIQKDIDHLPVVRKQKTVGIVTSDSLVFRMVPPERIARESWVSERQRQLNLQVSGLMMPDPVTSTPDTDVSEVIREMSRRETTYSLVELWGELQGIITYRDCVKLLTAPVTETVPISIIGLPSDPFEGEVAKAKFERIAKRLARSLPDLAEARSVIRTFEKTGRRRRYEVEVSLVTPSRTTSFSSSGWSLPEIFDELSDKMKRLTTKKPKPRRRRLE